MVRKFMRRSNRRAKPARPVISAPLTSIPESELPTALRRHPHFVVLPGGPSQVVRRNAIRRRPAPPTGSTGATPAPKNGPHSLPAPKYPMNSSNVDPTPVPQASKHPTRRVDLPLDESMDDLRYFLAELYLTENGLT